MDRKTRKHFYRILGLTALIAAVFVSIGMVLGKPVLSVTMIYYHDTAFVYDHNPIAVVFLVLLGLITLLLSRR